MIFEKDHWPHVSAKMQNGFYIHDMEAGSFQESLERIGISGGIEQDNDDIFKVVAVLALSPFVVVMNAILSEVGKDAYKALKRLLVGDLITNGRTERDKKPYEHVIDIRIEFSLSDDADAMHYYKRRSSPLYVTRMLTVEHPMSEEQFATLVSQQQPDIPPGSVVKASFKYDSESGLWKIVDEIPSP